jgi:zinc transport system ATP-binding protein
VDAIKINNLSFKYSKDLILENINLNVKEKDFLGIVGPNGGGKTTFLKLILGLLKPNKGKVKTLGSLSYVPQHLDIDKTFPIKTDEVVLMGLNGKKDLSLVKETLKKVNASNLYGKKFGDLSGGEKQKVLIARAIISKPDILVLDEPTANVDQKTTSIINTIIKDLNKTMTILLVSHQYDLITSNVKEVVCINKKLHHHDLKEVKDRGILIVDHKED